MSFQSLAFVLFLAVSLPICLWAGRKSAAAGQLCLLAACVVFGLQGALFWVLAAGAAVSLLSLRYLGQNRPARGRQWVLFAACVYHVGVLCSFKYLPLGLFPTGLSFFTFQQIWLLKEAYTRQFTPTNTTETLLHAAFFPTLTSGPILRPGSFYPQLKGESFLHPTEQDVAAGLYAICIGMAKKVLLADPLGTLVNNGWAMTASLSAPGAWLVMLCYTLQLYLDFSGYCDIATGIARLLGLRLPQNFNSPYHACSVTEFWKRWHITLTTFLRECLYFPLGGSRKGAARAYGNILIVFLVSGLWHGTGWTFLIWGLLHGLAQVAERAWGSRRERLPRSLRWGMTFLFVNLAWVFFRAPDLASAAAMFSAALRGGWGLPLEALTAGVLDSEVTALTTLLPAAKRYIPALAAALLPTAGMTVVLWQRNTLQNMETFRPRMGHSLLFALLLVWAILSFAGGGTFIYANF